MYVRNATDVQKSLRMLHLIVIKKSILKTYKKLKKIILLFICWSKYTKKSVILLIIHIIMIIT